MFQSRTSSALDRKLAKSKSALAGILRALTLWNHWPCTRLWRYSEGKGPQYERKAAAMRQSPGSAAICSSYVAMEPSQRSRSPPRPLTRAVARSSLISSSSDSCLRRSLFATLVLYFSLSASTFSVISWRLALAAARASCFCWRVRMAACTFARLGATSLAMRPYTSMARTHMHSDLAALDTAPTVSGSNSGLVVNLLTLLSSESTSWSLSKLMRRLRKFGSPSCFLASFQEGSALQSTMTPESTRATTSGGFW
mmetsp:Transcript_2035/g.5105  ORF Transcript_2035/g.5105 Transcript_2035/m.5105 type:complete len:254 (-) Transcript_2035:196-957(-)